MKAQSVLSLKLPTNLLNLFDVPKRYEPSSSLQNMSEAVSSGWSTCPYKYVMELHDWYLSFHPSIFYMGDSGLPSVSSLTSQPVSCWRSCFLVFAVVTLLPILVPHQVLVCQLSHLLCVCCYLLLFALKESHLCGFCIYSKFCA